MIVQMIAGEVCKNASPIGQPADTLLVDRMRTDFHEHIGASGFGHLCHERMQRHGIGGGMSCRYRFLAYIVAYRRDQSALVSQTAE